MLGKWSGYGVDYRENRAEFVRELESQKDSGRGIYGSGYLVPRAAMIEARNKAERNKAERNKAEQETNAIKWSLSPRELKIIETLEGADNGHNEKTNRKKE